MDEWEYLQTSLFDEEKPISNKKNKSAQKKDVIAVKKIDKKVSKQQAIFNDLNRKIASLKEEIKRVSTNHDEAHRYFIQKIAPELKCYVREQHDFAKYLYDEIPNRKFSQNQILNIYYFIDRIYRELGQPAGNPRAPHEVEAIEYIMDMTIEEIDEVQEEVEKDVLEMILSNLGIDIDPDGIDFKNPEEIARKMSEVREKIVEEKKAFKDEKKEQKKSKINKKSDDNDSAAQRTINEIYKGLAKLTHPDLVSDPDDKIAREELMKEITAAYTANNLYDLLTLEMKWAMGEKDRLTGLPEKILRSYNEVLEEQYYSLNDSLYELYYLPGMAEMNDFKETYNGGDFSFNREISLNTMKKAFIVLKFERSRLKIISEKMYHSQSKSEYKRLLNSLLGI